MKTNIQTRRRNQLTDSLESLFKQSELRKSENVSKFRDLGTTITNRTEGCDEIKRKTNFGNE
jgi:hypothetical protein